ncbi:hypothetical protein L484_010179 [Morus notabilis]|uniref:Uncharacterized protein n=1 Tax=Morus notabilis TaxID=981085 RepID=W9QI31_9ROSA|nr:hypothetical protein L484_010179 [Morus notabilis]
MADTIGIERIHNRKSPNFKPYRRGKIAEFLSHIAKFAFESTLVESLSISTEYRCHVINVTCRKDLAFAKILSSLENQNLCILKSRDVKRAVPGRHGPSNPRPMAGLGRARAGPEEKPSGPALALGPSP